ncbi:unnamed protein product [Phytomonas sp. Hart1]|nr:unnamed protein product [Phytomonas sp. Hart1]|eukprot:CCW70186.1 unnamed protein product [Phytomonas sp. isolate Hart1]
MSVKDISVTSATVTEKPTWFSSFVIFELFWFICFVVSATAIFKLRRRAEQRKRQVFAGRRRFPTSSVFRSIYRAGNVSTV